MKGNFYSSDSIMRTRIKKDEIFVPHYLLISERFDSMGSSQVVTIYKAKILQKEIEAGAEK